MQWQKKNNKKIWLE